MKNIKLVLEYDGSNYIGWQRQKTETRVHSIQYVIENTLKELLREDVTVIGCSRTDSGVHARQYVLNFNTETSIPADRIKYALNDKLPEDIVVLNSEETSMDFHARYSSKGKLYMYTIVNREARLTIDRRYAYQHKWQLDMALMREACKYFIGTHDFKSFMKKGSSVKTTVRTISSLEVQEQGDFIRIYAAADGFLYNMVRIIVGTLLEVGEGKIQPEDIVRIIESRDRNKAGKTAPAQGLTLLEVLY
ncbi:tRNA pseudouridine38-40 synthase [Hathewaya proteolytica DSM 3090]|uniref:tRNA pseudouridine synthase A n=1 Tax=Hathewaya proteolytica DSM 3090 TaxID=1121331 RepID=A0A1M6SUA5_9CLOT|nr:tRNA pseudouridine(38-40) synthase TruA [Hathewaya proteolytica]SHK48227.1 tRNA pseudouridine38-40 synthase [Hathewaya proteolytica DSM 3090]